MSEDTVEIGVGTEATDRWFGGPKAGVRIACTVVVPEQHLT